MNVAPGDSLNVFRFIETDGDASAHTYSLPAVMVDPEGSLNININENDYLINLEDKERVYHVNINQLKENSRYWFEIFLDGESQVKVENTHANSYSNVNLYTGLGLCLGTNNQKRLKSGDFYLDLICLSNGQNMVVFFR